LDSGAAFVDSVFNRCLDRDFKSSAGKYIINFLFSLQYDFSIYSHLYIFKSFLGSVEKNLALLQNQCKPLQLGKLINQNIAIEIHSSKIT
jgi:hypothetical protein